ncbi:hypothetical protein BDZ89DRAFT_677479 [Hymenopellis radicata]|nr:hypothetical protein BDZ89DRAFT_677479 [Hymenopellis radicata]
MSSTNASTTTELCVPLFSSIFWEKFVPHRLSCTQPKRCQDFITIAFKAARAADSTAKLYINDYNMDSNNAKVQGMIALVKRINSAGTVIDAIGTQMHLNEGGASDAQAALTALASSGVSLAEVAITELDIAGTSPADYTAVVEACLALAITSWNSWRTGVTPDRSVPVVGLFTSFH